MGCGRRGGAIYGNKSGLQISGLAFLSSTFEFLVRDIFIFFPVLVCPQSNRLMIFSRRSPSISRWSRTYTIRPCSRSFLVLCILRSFRLPFRVTLYGRCITIFVTFSFLLLFKPHFILVSTVGAFSEGSNFFQNDFTLSIGHDTWVVVAGNKDCHSSFFGDIVCFVDVWWSIFCLVSFRFLFWLSFFWIFQFFHDTCEVHSDIIVSSLDS